MKSSDQVDAAIRLAISEAGRYGDGEATLTAFRSGYYPLRGHIVKSFIEKMKTGWEGNGWYSIAHLDDIFPMPLGIVGSGDTQQELEDDLAELLSDWKGHFVGFGENPFDTDPADWALRNHVEFIETTVGSPRWARPRET